VIEILAKRTQKWWSKKMFENGQLACATRTLLQRLHGKRATAHAARVEL
jgi:hypothetical protein